MELKPSAPRMRSFPIPSELKTQTQTISRLSANDGLTAAQLQGEAPSSVLADNAKANRLSGAPQPQTEIDESNAALMNGPKSATDAAAWAKDNLHNPFSKGVREYSSYVSHLSVYARNHSVSLSEAHDTLLAAAKDPSAPDHALGVALAAEEAAMTSGAIQQKLDGAKVALIGTVKGLQETLIELKKHPEENRERIALTEAAIVDGKRRALALNALGTVSVADVVAGKADNAALAAVNAITTGDLPERKSALKVSLVGSQNTKDSSAQHDPHDELVQGMVREFIESSVGEAAARGMAGEVLQRFGAELASEINQSLGEGTLAIDSVGATLEAARSRLENDLFSSDALPNPKTGAGSGIDTSSADGVSDFFKGAQGALTGANVGFGAGGSWDFGGKGFAISGSAAVTFSVPGGKDAGIGFDFTRTRSESSLTPGIATGKAASGKPSVTTVDELKGRSDTGGAKDAGASEREKNIDKQSRDQEGGDQQGREKEGPAQHSNKETEQTHAENENGQTDAKAKEEGTSPPTTSSSHGEEGDESEGRHDRSTMRAAAIREGGAIRDRRGSGGPDENAGMNDGPRRVNVPKKKVGTSGSDTDAGAACGNGVSTQPTRAPLGAKIDDQDVASPTTNPR